MLSECSLRSLPSELGHLTSLIDLDLTAVGLETLPITIGKLSSLAVLKLGRNHLSNLPDTIGDLVNLKHLTLWGNRLYTVPRSISKLSSLHHIELGGNRFSALPSVVFLLPKLRSLGMFASNPLSYMRAHSLYREHLPSLRDLAATCVLNHRIDFQHVARDITEWMAAEARPCDGCHRIFLGPG